MIVRLIVVLVLAGFVAGGALRFRRWQAGLHADVAPMPAIPAAIVAGAERTWVVFTTPWCASCGPVEAELRAADPAARLVTVDATREPHLASAFRVRSAPTVLLAGAGGEVTERLVGPQAVRSYLAGSSL